MKKKIEKLGKIFTALIYTLYTFIAPLTVLNVHAYSNGEIIGDGTVSANNGKNSTDQGYINVTKTVTHEEGDPEGVYTINFNIKGNNYESTNQVPSYTVFVLDASDSMDDEVTIGGSWLFPETTTRFDEAKKAIIAASQELVKNPQGKVALVEFGTDSDPDKIVGFKHSAFTDSDFKQSWGGTNYDAGLMNAKDLIETIINEDGVKNIIFISDGQPSVGLAKNETISSYDNWWNTSNYVYESYREEYYYTTSDPYTYLNDNVVKDLTVKGFRNHESGTSAQNAGHTFNNINYTRNDTLSALKSLLKGTNNNPNNNIYSFSYHLNNTNYQNILKKIATSDANGEQRWKNVDAETIKTELEKIADEISQSSAGVNASLTDEIGADFSVINNGDFEIVEGDMTYSLDSIPTGDGENISFKIKINPYAATGEHDTNGSFDLKYKVSESDTEYEHVTTSESPKIYWIAPESKIKVNYYLDGTTTSISEQIESPQKVVTNEDGTRNTYTAESKEIYGYTLVKANTEVFDGTTAAPSEDYTIADNGDVTVLYYIDGTTVNYYYTKNDITIDDSTAIDKDGDTDKKGLNSEFNYTIDYNIKVDDYIGDVGAGTDVNITVTDTLPYEIDEDNENTDLAGGTYDSNNKTITWTIPKTTITNASNSTINFNKTIKVYYKNINTDTVTNNISATITKGNSNLKTSNDSYTNEMAKGKVLVYHVDEQGNLLIPEAEVIEEYVDKAYTTSAKTNITGYTWNNVVPANNAGSITAETKTATYVYTKNTGIDSIKSESLTKTGPASVSKTTDAFNYAISYRAEIENYVGNATLLIKDTPQYKVDQTKLSDELKAVYDEATNTFTWTVNANGINGNRVITFNKDLEIYYIQDDIKSNSVLNTVTSELSFTGEEETSELSKNVTTTIPSGVVNVHYYFDNVEKENTTVNGLVGNSYTTSSTPANTSTYGYTLTNTVGPVSGTFESNPIEVKFYYTKNDGSITDDVNKVITNKEEAIQSLDNKFKYTITYNGTVTDFVGNATLTITDTPSAKINKDLSNLDGGDYDAETNTITWTVNYEITGETEIEVIKNIELVFIADEVTGPISNNVQTHLELENGSDSTDEDTTEEVEVQKGLVQVKYVYNEDLIPGTEVETVKNDYVGKSYTTSAKSIYGYTWDNVTPDNATGNITKEDIMVIYNYNKNDGLIDEKNTTITKASDNKDKKINDKFEYTVTFNSKVDDFVGEGTVTFTDTLPYEINTQNSELNGGSYDSREKTITWVETYNIPASAETNENDRKISITKTFKVEYVGITSENLTDEQIQNTEVINAVNATIEAGNSSYTTNDVTASNKMLYGTVTTHHTDENSNPLAADVVTYGFTGEDYTTSPLDNIYGYTWNEQNPDKYLGQYNSSNINVTYIYVNKPGDLTSEEITKELTNADNAVITLENSYNYTIHYSATIEDYVGSATLIIIDTPSYKVDAKKSNLDGGVYDPDTNTITWTIVYDETTEYGLINQNNYTITFDKNLELYFVADEVDGPIGNHVDSTLTFGETETPNEADAEEVEPNTSSISEIYVYIGENEETEIADKIGPTSDYVGKSYTITKKDIYGYTYKETENNTDKYLEKDTTIKHVYTKNKGEITDEETSKTSDEQADSINSEFNYTISYHATLTDYVGTAYTTLIDHLPYKIDIEKSDLKDGIYNEEDNTITWTVETEINEKNKDIDFNKEIKLFYLDITDKLVKNNLNVETNYDSSISKTEDDAETIIKTGKVTVHYVDIDGNTLLDDIILEDLVGKSYQTEEKEIGTYYVEEIIGYTEGTFTEKDQEVTYVYDLSGEGGDDIIPPQTGYELNLAYNVILTAFLFLVAIKIKKYN